MSRRGKSVEDLIGQAMLDTSFRNRLLRSPEETLAAEGYEVSPEVVDAIKSASREDINAALADDPSDRRAAT